MKIIKAIDPDAALHASADFVDFVLEPPQGLNDSFVNEPLAAHYPALAFDQAATADHAAGHVAALGEFKNLPHLSRADDVFFDGRLEQARHCLLHLVNQFVNDRVKLDLHSLPFGDVGHPDIDARVEAKDDPFGSGRQMDIRLGDRADGAVDHFQRDFLGLDFLKRFDDGLDRPLGIGLDHNFENLGRRSRQSIENRFQRHLGARFGALGARLLGSLLRQHPRVLFVLDRAKFQPRLGHAIQAEHFHRH